MKVKKKDKNKDEDLRLWDEAINDAEQMIRKLKQQVAGLQDSIRFFKTRRDTGAPYPSD